MPTSQRYLDAMLDLDAAEAVDDVLWHACKPTAVRVMDGVVVCDVPFEAYQPTHRGRAFAETFVDEATPRQTHALVVRAYGEGIVRVTLAPGLTADDPLALPEDHGMLAWDPALNPEPLRVQRTDAGWDALDTAGRVRWQVNTSEAPTRQWSELIPPPRETLAATVFPDGCTAVPFMAYDQFFPKQVESLPLAFVERAGTIDRMAWALHAMPHERFAGTGERFAKMDMAGQTLELANTDALGTNNRRAYKNVPFYLSSRPYGLLALRDLYLPAGQWVDFWSGEVFSGPGWRTAVRSPLARIPVYVRRDAVLPVYAQPVACTDEMNMDDSTTIRFDASYRGLAQSVLGSLVDL